MSAVRQVHAHNRIAGRGKREVNRRVSLCARMRLNVGISAVEQLFGAVDSKLFGNVDKFTTAVVTLTGIALGVFVCKNRALRLHDRLAHDVFRCDKFKLIALAIEFIFHRREKFGVFLQTVHQIHNATSKIF